MTYLRDKRLWAVLALVAVLLALRLAGLGDLLSLENLARHRHALLELLRAHQIEVMASYIALYAAVVGFSLPGAVVLTLAGGFLFGAALGTGLTVVGATLGAMAAFQMARRLFGADALERLGPRAARIAEGLRRDAFAYLLVLRLVPLFPFVLVNLVPALTGVRFGTFALTTLIGIIPGTAVYSLAGAGLGEVLEAGGTPQLGSILTPGVIGALIGLAALSLLSIPLRRRFEK